MSSDDLRASAASAEAHGRDDLARGLRAAADELDADTPVRVQVLLVN